MAEPMNVTRWGARAVDTDLVRVYINGMLFDFNSHAAAELAQTIRVILGTEEPTPVVPGISAELLGETIVTLERVGCQFQFCQGPTLAPVPMRTCFVCETLAKLQQSLASGSS